MPRAEARRTAPGILVEKQSEREKARLFTDRHNCVAANGWSCRARVVHGSVGDVQRGRTLEARRHS